MQTIKNILLPWRWFGYGDGCRPQKCVSLTPEEKLALRLRPYQQYLYKLQELLIWKQPLESFMFLVSVNIIFFLLGWMRWRFYGVVCWSLLALILHEAWVYRIWPEIRAVEPPVESKGSPEQPPPEGMLSIPELSKCATSIHSIATSIYIKLKLLRQHHPSFFCSAMVSMILVIAKVGASLSGFWLLYMVVMFAILGPGLIFHFVPPKMRENMAGFFSHLATMLQPSENDKEVEDYLPDPSKDNLTLFNLASGELIDKTNVSTPSSDTDVLPVDPIPSHDESSVDCDFSHGLEPMPPESSLSFKATHFNGSTLSAALRQALADTLGPNLVSPLFIQQQIAEQSDSDSSEFELIDPDDPPPT